MLSFVAVMVVTGMLVNLSYSFATQNQMYEFLDILIENEGVLPEQGESEGMSRTAVFMQEYRKGLRYFSVIYDSEGEVEEVNLSYTTVIEKDEALRLAVKAERKLLDYGTLSGYYYRTRVLEDGRRIFAFVNGAIQLEVRDQVLRYTTLICGAGLFLTFFIVWKVSSRVIKPEIENAKRQKEFITNASHELKTPLAVIRANTEVIEMLSGENEWTDSTLRQVEHMNGLIQNLVMIARAEEMEDRTALGEIDLSRVVRESADPYRSLAVQEKKEFTQEIAEGITLNVDESKIRQLTSILVDNAFKYCDPEGTIQISLESQKKGKLVVLTVANSYAEGEHVDVDRFFDRFYREDESHENQKGYGIGLSMAESIVEIYGGSIRAEWKDGIISFICVLK